MIRRSKDIRVRNVEHAQGGDGSVSFFDWLLPEEASGHGRLFSKLIIPSGCSIGYHTHQDEFEAYYVLEGQAAVNDNGEVKILNAGDMHICSDGDGHETVNNGDEELVLLALIMNTL